MSIDPVADPTFYTLPAHLLDEGMSTADGQDILDVQIETPEHLRGASAGRDCALCRAITTHHTDRHADFADVYVHVYTPADDPAEDAEHRRTPETRVYAYHERVDLAVFPNTPVDGSSRDGAALTA